MAKKQSAERPALRKQIIRVDASVGHAESEIARIFGLPGGCIRLVRPDGRKARTNKLIGSLLDDWGVDY